MKLNYQLKNGQLYAKIPGVSVRKDGKIVKENVVYLGRVIDKDHNVFWNRERGIYTYDPETGVYGKADESYSSQLDTDKRVREKILLDFGDAFFVDELIHKSGYDKVIESIPYRNKDSLYGLAMYYILCNSANSHAKTWYEGSYAKLLYPRANLTSQRLSDFLDAIGQPDTLAKFFDAQVQWIKDNISDDPAVLIDSTGLPNSIHFPLTAISNHNGKVSKEVRLTVVIQRDSGYPMLFRMTPGNIVDMTTVTRTVNELLMRDMSVDLAILDAGYFTNDNVEELFFAGIDFITRLSSKYTLYKDIVKKHLSTLRREENMVEYNGRYVYLKMVECKIGHKGHTAYAYLGYDIDRASDEAHKILKNAKSKKQDTASLHKEMENTGLFMLVATLPYSCEGILPAYYTRQLVEQYFDIGKGISNLTPLRVHSEESLTGHLMMSTIAATINVMIQRKTKDMSDNREELFMSLRNQKCIAYKTKVTTTEAQKKANEYYSAFDIKCPIYLDRDDNSLTPRYHLPKVKREEM